MDTDLAGPPIDTDLAGPPMDTDLAGPPMDTDLAGPPIVTSFAGPPMDKDTALAGGAPGGGGGGAPAPAPPPTGVTVLGLNSNDAADGLKLKLAAPAESLVVFGTSSPPSSLMLLMMMRCFYECAFRRICSSERRRRKKFTPVGRFLSERSLRTESADCVCVSVSLSRHSASGFRASTRTHAQSSKSSPFEPFFRFVSFPEISSFGHGSTTL